MKTRKDLKASRTEGFHPRVEDREVSSSSNNNNDNINSNNIKVNSHLTTQPLIPPLKQPQILTARSPTPSTPPSSTSSKLNRRNDKDDARKSKLIVGLLVGAAVLGIVLLVLLGLAGRPSW